MLPSSKSLASSPIKHASAYVADGFVACEAGASEPLPTAAPSEVTEAVLVVPDGDTSAKVESAGVASAELSTEVDGSAAEGDGSGAGPWP
eukprot:scaffold111_cov252-Pinguiococcus_pyrenoidosus.AAC.24